MGKTIPIDTYFKRKNDKNLQTESLLPTSNADTLIMPTSDVDPPIVNNFFFELRPPPIHNPGSAPGNT